MDLESITAVAELDRWLGEHNLGGSWQRPAGPSEPPRYPTYPPFLWRWADVEEGLRAAGRLIDQDSELAEKMAGYKHMGFNLPGMRPGTMPTINMGAQVLMPGELGEARRHLQAELRFIVKGHPGAVAVVEGEPFPMEDRDFLSTPAWSWYDWANHGDEPVLWVNAGDLALTRMVVRFRDVHPERRQPIEKAAGYTQATLGPARPSAMVQALPTPPFRYPWAETLAALQALAAAGPPDPYDGFLLGYPHPLTGGPTTPTMAAEIQLVPGRFKTGAHRHNCTVRYHVVEGHGATVIEDERLEWTDKDCFVVPPWCWHSHENLTGEDAILFSVSDRPAMAALEFYREEVQK